MYGLNKYFFQVVDLLGKAITSGFAITVNTINTATAATIYADGNKTALTNPITVTVFDALTTGIVEFYTSATSVDVKIIGANGAMQIDGLTPMVNRIVFDATRADVHLAYSLPAAGTVLTNSIVKTALATKTLVGGELKAGDVIRVRAQGIVVSSNSTDTLAVDLTVGTESIVAIGATDAADNDVFTIEADIVVRVGGAAAYLTAMGQASDLEAVGSHAMTRFNMAAAAESLAGNVAVAVNGTWSVAHAANQVRCDIFTVEILPAA